MGDDMKIRPDISTQRGAATLLVSVIVLIAVTLLIMFAVRVGILDQRISGNELRHKEAFSNAEAALEQAASYLRVHPALNDGNVTDGWTACNTGDAFPCTLPDVTMVLKDGGGGYLPTTTSTDSLAYLVKTVTGTIAVGEGLSDDATGAARVQVEYASASLLTPGKIPPLMIPTGSLSGNFNIVPDPNGGGLGVPISVWAKDTLDTVGANWKTCDHGEFKDGGEVCMDTKGDGVTGDDWLACSCDAERSNTSNVTEDVVVYSSGFPDSPFAYVFGGEEDIAAGKKTAAEFRAEIKSRAEATGLVLADCSAINTDFNALDRPALVWVTGDCSIGSNITVGSRVNPIILVVEGELRVSAGAELWGILFGWTDFVLNGGPVIHGSAISEIASDLTNGTYNQVYDAQVFESLRGGTVNNSIVKQPYSWRDF